MIRETLNALMDVTTHQDRAYAEAVDREIATEERVKNSHLAGAEERQEAIVQAIGKRAEELSRLASGRNQRDDLAGAAVALRDMVRKISQRWPGDEWAQKGAGPRPKRSKGFSTVEGIEEQIRAQHTIKVAKHAEMKTDGDDSLGVGVEIETLEELMRLSGMDFDPFGETS